MDYANFINKEVINKNNEVGIVLMFDDEHIVIKYPSETKTYNPDVAFKTGYITFKNKELKQAISQDVAQKNEIAIRKEKDNQSLLLKKKIARKTYSMLLRKAKYLQILFGSDFVYPPLEEFENKYKYLIEEKKKYSEPYFGYDYYGTPWF